MMQNSGAHKSGYFGIIVIFLYSIFMVASCQQPISDNPEVEGGTFVGRVKIIDNQKEIYQDNSGILVKILETGDSTYSDSGGNWMIGPVSNDSSYSLLFSKNGIGSRHLYHQSPTYNHPYMNDHLLETYMLEIPSYTIITHGVDLTEDSLIVFGQFSDNALGTVCTFIDTTRFVGREDGHSIAGSFSPDYWRNTYNYPYSLNYLASEGIKSGQMCFITSYPMNTSSLVEWADINWGAGEAYWTGMSPVGSGIDSIRIYY